LFSNNQAVELPTKILVPGGSTTGTFSVKSSMVLADQNVKIAAIRANVNPFTNEIDPAAYKVASITIRAHTIVGLTVSPNPVAGGDPVTGVVRLSYPAPAGGAIVYLFSSDTNSASVPATIKIAAGERSGTFTVGTKVIEGAASVVITASMAPNRPPTAVTRSVTLKVNRGLRITDLVFEPDTVRGAEFTNLKITLNGTVPGTTPITIALKASNPDLVVMPNSVTVQPGEGPVVFVRVTANRVARDLATEVTATLNGVSVTTTLKVIR
jgi:hypothetical protein